MAPLRFKTFPALIDLERRREQQGAGPRSGLRSLSRAASAFGTIHAELGGSAVWRLRRHACVDGPRVHGGLAPRLATGAPSFRTPLSPDTCDPLSHVHWGINSRHLLCGRFLLLDACRLVRGPLCAEGPGWSSVGHLLRIWSRGTRHPRIHYIGRLCRPDPTPGHPRRLGPEGCPKCRSQIPNARGSGESPLSLPALPRGLRGGRVVRQRRDPASYATSDYRCRIPRA